MIYSTGTYMSWKSFNQDAHSFITTVLYFQTLNSKEIPVNSQCNVFRHLATSRMNCMNGYCMTLGIKPHTWGVDSEINTGTAKEPRDKQRHCKPVLAVQISYSVLP